jgi:hypothetical protein
MTGDGQSTGRAGLSDRTLLPPRSHTMKFYSRCLDYRTKGVEQILVRMYDLLFTISVSYVDSDH